MSFLSERGSLTPERSGLSRSLLIMTGILFTSCAFAEDAWLEKSRSILEQSRQQSIPDWLQKAMVRKADVRDIQLPTPKALGFHEKGSSVPNGPITRLFISEALGIEALRAATEETKGHRNRVLVFRGLPEGKSLKTFVGSFRSLVEGTSKPEMPSLTIDPEAFTRNGIDRVPAIVIEERNHQVAIVRGITHVDWLEDQHARNPASIDFGVRGDTVAISEPDLIETLKQRFRTFDWASYKQEVRDSFWQKTSFESLPEAKVDHTFWVDPSVTAPRDLRDAAGHVIVFQGQKVNPLESLPFHQRLIVFNPQSERQIGKVRDLFQKDPSRRNTLIATEMDRLGGWQTFENLQKVLGSRVFLLTPEIRKRFKLKSSPSVIEAEDHRLRIHEIGMEQPG